MKTKILTILIVLSSMSIALGQKSWSDGVNAFNKNDYYGAIGIFNDYISQNVQNTENISIAINLEYCYLYRGIAKFYTFNSNQVKEDFSNCLKLDPPKKFKSSAFLYTGLVDYYSSNTPKAIESINKAIEVDSKNSDALISRGIIYKKTGKNTEAESDFNAVLEIEKKQGYNRSLANYYLGKNSEAEAEITKLITEKNDVYAYYIAACTYALLNKTDEAFKNLDIALNKGFRCYVYLFNDEKLNAIRKKSDFYKILSKYRSDKMIDFFIVRDSLSKSCKTNSYIYPSWNVQVILPISNQSSILETSPQYNIPFAYLFNEDYFKTFQLPKNGYYEYTWDKDKKNPLTFNFDLNYVNGLNDYFKEIENADQFTLKENDQKYRLMFIDSWKKLNKEYDDHYLKKDSLYIFKAVNSSKDNKGKLNSFLFDTKSYSLDNNNITLPLLYDGGVYQNYYVDELPQFWNVKPENRLIKMDIPIEIAKNLIRGDENVYYEKIYTVKFVGGLNTSFFSNISTSKNEAIFMTNIIPISIHYYFYKESQWDARFKAFTGAPYFQYYYLFYNY